MAAMQQRRFRRFGLFGWLGSFLLLTLVLFLVVGYFLAASLSKSFTDSSLDDISATTATYLQLHAEPVVVPPTLLSTPKRAGTPEEQIFSRQAYTLVKGLPFYSVKFWSPQGQLVWRDRQQEQIGSSDAANPLLQQAITGHSAYQLNPLSMQRNETEGIDALLDLYVPLYTTGDSNQPVGVVEVAQDVSELYNNLQVGQQQVYFIILFATIALYVVLVIVVVVAAVTVRRYQQRGQRRENLLLELRRQFSPAVADAILALGDNQMMTKSMTARVEASVLFVDIRNFTNQAVAMPPEDVVAMLNAYMDTGTRVIFSYDGVVDKFLGDGILAVFGIPNSQPDHALRACVAALSLRRELVELNAHRTAEGKPSILVGMGVASGPVVAGNIGSANQLTYTVIGDTVNLASRLVGMAAADEILVTESTVKLAGSRMQVTGGELAKVRGRDEAVRVYRLPDQPITPLLASASGERPILNLTTRLSEVDTETAVH